MSRSYRQLAGWCAVVAGGAALAYSITFAIVVQDGARWAQWTSTLLLALGSFVALPVVTALYLQVRALDEGFALLGFLVGSLGAAGTLLHATFDLGVLANQPAQTWEHPSPTDPRGFATFLLAGATIALFSTMLGRLGAPRGLVRLGWVVAVLLAWVWLGRLTALDPKTTWVAPAVVGSGFIGVPLWYVWLGHWMLRAAAAARDVQPGRSSAARSHAAASAAAS